jgi:hypothetical protein
MLRVAGLRSRNLVGIGRPVAASGGGGGGGGGGTFNNLNSISYFVSGGPSPAPTVNVQFTTEADRDAALTALTTIGESFDAFGNYIDPNDNMMYSGNYTFIIDGSSITGSYSSSQWYIQVVVQTVTTFTNTGASLPPGSASYSLALTGSGGGGGTYVGGTDYTISGGPPGISFMSPGGPFTSDGVIVDPSAWSNTAGSTALLALGSGGTFTVSTTPSGGGAPITSTITLTSSWASLYGTAQRADMTASPPVATNYPDYIPFSVTVGGGGGGGGGGGTTVTLTNGIWDPTGVVSFQVLVSDTTNTALMDAIPSGATLTISDGINTTTVTLTGGLSKSGPGGPPGYERYYWGGNVTTSNPNFPSEYGSIISLSY